MLIRKLCLAHAGDQITDEAPQDYVYLFDKPLVESHVKAILALFGWDSLALPLVGEDVEVVRGA